MRRKKTDLPPQEADESLSRDLLLRYMAARAANLRLVAMLRPVPPDDRAPGSDELQEPFVS